MFSLYTTEENLSDLCLQRGNWYNIINNQSIVYVSSKDGGEEWDINNPVLINLHKAGISIEVENKLADDIKKDHSKVLKLDNPVYLIDIDEAEAKKIEEEYGVICKNIKKSDEVGISDIGWDIDTSDTSKEQSWNFFFKGIKTPLNSLVVIDRYFFSSEKNKTKSSLNETIDDSFYNLSEILNSLLPKKAKDSVVSIVILFDYDTLADEMGFKELVEKVNKLKKTINRTYVYNIELISLNKDCYRYKDTHDRFIISNYFLVKATHKVKAFRRGNLSLVPQSLYFDYIFSKGIKPGEKSSIPIITQDRILNAIKDSLKTSKNIILHGCNGKESEKGNFIIKNRLLFNS